MIFNLIPLIISLVLYTLFPISSIPEQVDPYYNEFLTVVKNECPKIETPKQIAINLKNLKNEEVGLCYLFTFRKQIELDTTYWVNASDQMRKQLVFHELTHCILETHHIEDLTNYMNPYVTNITNEALLEQVKINARAYCN